MAMNRSVGRILIWIWPVMKWMIWSSSSFQESSWGMWTVSTRFQQKRSSFWSELEFKEAKELMLILASFFLIIAEGKPSPFLWIISSEMILKVVTRTTFPLTQGKVSVDFFRFHFYRINRICREICLPILKIKTTNDIILQRFCKILTILKITKIVFYKI